MSTIADAFVQIIPSADGISGKLNNLLSGEVDVAGKRAGDNFGAKMVGAIKGVVAAAGIGAAFKAAIDQGGALQQSIGGVETLYGEAADAIKGYAAEAYKYGLSTNDYMEQSTSFAAALKQSLGGDAVAAAEAANIALEDMADNSAKMGTDMASIQNAYQGFAKQNYTMLDNLKIGYGGTKTEMQRLLEDATKLSGVEYNIENLSDVYEAIHVIQTDLGLTGVAADEAKTTFTGSFQAMQASAQNFLGAIALGENIKPALQSLFDTTTTFLIGNFIPMVANIVGSIPSIVVEGIQALASMDWGSIVTQIMTTLSSAMSESISVLTTGADLISQIEASITENLPAVLAKGVEIITELVNGILSNLPELITTAGNIISEFIGFVMDNLPAFAEAGVNMMLNLINGLISSIPSIIAAMVNVLAQMTATILEHLPDYLRKGIEIIVSLVSGLMDAIPQAVSAILQIIGEMLNTIASEYPNFLAKGIEVIGEVAKGLIQAVPTLVGKIPEIFKSVQKAFTDQDWLSIGKNIMKGVADGVKKGASAIADAAKDAAKSALDAAKNLLGIHSPSRVFRDQVGMMIPAGVAEGIEQNLSPIKGAMELVSDAALGSVNANIKTALTGSVSRYNGGIGLNGTGNGFTQNITINSPRELTPSEIARQTRNATRNMVLALR